MKNLNKQLQKRNLIETAGINNLTEQHPCITSKHERKPKHLQIEHCIRNFSNDLYSSAIVTSQMNHLK